MSVTLLVVKSYFHTAPGGDVNRQSWEYREWVVHTIASVLRTCVIIR